VARVVLHREAREATAAVPQIADPVALWMQLNMSKQAAHKECALHPGEQSGLSPSGVLFICGEGALQRARSIFGVCLVRAPAFVISLIGRARGPGPAWAQCVVGAY
jgi:hypothetical protein